MFYRGAVSRCHAKSQEVSLLVSRLDVGHGPRKVRRSRFKWSKKVGSSSSGDLWDVSATKDRTKGTHKFMETRSSEDLYRRIRLSRSIHELRLTFYGREDAPCELPSLPAPFPRTASEHLPL